MVEIKELRGGGCGAGVGLQGRSEARGIKDRGGRVVHHRKAVTDPHFGVQGQELAGELIMRRHEGAVVPEAQGVLQRMRHLRRLRPLREGDGVLIQISLGERLVPGPQKGLARDIHEGPEGRGVLGMEELGGFVQK